MNTLQVLKSVILTLPRQSRDIISGVRHRWTIPLSWRWETARTICAPIKQISLSWSDPLSDINDWSVVLGMLSVRKQVLQIETQRLRIKRKYVFIIARKRLGKKLSTGVITRHNMLSLVSCTILGLRRSNFGF